MRLPLALAGCLAAVVGWPAYGGPSSNGATTGAGSFTCSVASITDGDTFRCAEVGADGRQVRVRLSGISARERDGSCGVGHPCPAATAEASTAALDRLAAGQVLTCQANGETYGRIAAFCSTAGGVDLSCAMLASGTVERWDRHWRGHRC